MTTSGTTSDNEWRRVVQRMTTSGATSDTASDKEWPGMTTGGATNENEWKRMRASKRVILGLEWNKICNVQQQYIQECKLFINWEIDDTYVQYNILCFYFASISSCFSLSVLLEFIKAC